MNDLTDITDELIMSYVEGKLNKDESFRFEDILRKNKYLNDRVSFLKEVINHNPDFEPNINFYQLHNLSRINKGDKLASLKFFFKNIIHRNGFLTNRPIFAVLILISFLLLSTTYIFNQRDGNAVSLQESLRNENYDESISEKDNTKKTLIEKSSTIEN